MGFPSQFMPAVAFLDVISTIAATIHLGILPFDQTPSAIQTVLSTVGADVSFLDRIRGKSASAKVINAAAASLAKVNPPRRGLLFIVLAVCLARCSSIFTIWKSITAGISRVRSGEASIDFSGQAIGYSAICIISMLVNLSILNLLFQTHTIGSAYPDTSIYGIISQLNGSSLAAEQLIISAIEWILFVLFMGTNRSLINPSAASSASRTNQRNTAAPAIQESTPVSGISQANKKKDYGALSQSTQPSELTESEGQRTNDSSTKHITSPPTVPSSEGQTTIDPSSHDESKRAGDVSLDTERNASTSATSAQNTMGDATPSDIVDMPSDRKQGKEDARDRLRQARENGKVRRRSLWKKIRGKASLGNSNNAENES